MAYISKPLYTIIGGLKVLNTLVSIIMTVRIFKMVKTNVVAGTTGHYRVN